MRYVLSVLFAGLVAVGFAQAPPSAAEISGVVVDAAGAGVPGAAVELLSAQRVLRTTTTDRAGAFRFEKVGPGSYQVRAMAPLGTGTVPVSVTTAATASLRIVLGNPAAPAPPHTRTEAVAVERHFGDHAGRAVAAASMPSYNMAQGVGGFAPAGPGPFNTEAYSKIDENGFHRVTDDPLSTFSIDVDTASYANVRRFLNDGTLPPADAVRVEELINYFAFDYGMPTDGRPFAITTEVGPAPWAPAHRLVLIGLKAREIEQGRTPPRNLVFLLDVSGSMASPDKLPLVKTAMRMLAATLTPADRVAIVVYAGASGLVLPSTSGADRARIEQAVEDLRPGGSTNGAAGIQLAYDIAQQSFIKGGINRVILASDGDFNVGVTSQGDLIRLIEEKRERGVFLSVLGVGTGNIKDSTMEQLANRGNGNYSYLDSLHEARRVLVAEGGGTLVTVAKDVKIQVEFNPAKVGAYRLVGYENRLLANRDFNDDRKDAGEIGAGHTVTALYEIVPAGVEVDIPGVDPLKYQTVPRPSPGGGSDELLTVKLRYKQPDGDASQLISAPVRDRSGALTANLGFASAVAEFGMLLRHSEHAGRASWTEARDLARRHRGPDPDGYRAEFVRLVELAAALDAQGASSPQSHR
jgi:Ca-activated chloride channel family protein